MLIQIPRKIAKTVKLHELNNLKWEKGSLKSYCQAVIASISDEQCSILEGNLPSFLCTAPKAERDRHLVKYMMESINNHTEYMMESTSNHIKQKDCIYSVHI